MSELLTEFQYNIDAVSIIPSSGGVFEVTLNDELLFSKKNLGRHAEKDEVIALFRKSFSASS
ncbi:MAG: Rdx family protein [Anaerolineales bacterium]|nr:Rdx family protein [Anaerolineales bacterium]